MPPLSRIANAATRRQPIVMLTAYDYPTARLADAAVDVLLVGDSVGTNVLGYRSEREVTMETMIHHGAAVARGADHASVLVDMPFGSCDSGPQARANAERLCAAGAEAVKLEGHRPDIVKAVVSAGIEVCAHLGLTPQLHDQIRMQARTAPAARRLLEQARELEQAGAVMLVLELIPEEVGAFVTERLTIPTIGIAAGRRTDGQVLVIHDMLGLNQRPFRHVKTYETLDRRIRDAAAAFAEDVRQRRFPDACHVRHLAPEDAADLFA